MTHEINELSVQGAPTGVDIAPEVLTQLRKYRELTLRAKIYEEELRDTLRMLMEKHGVTSIENELFTVQFIGASVRNRFDSKEFKKDHPELYEEYMTESNVKSHVKMTYHDV